MFVYSVSTSTRLKDHTNSVGPWPSEWAHLDKPVWLDQLNHSLTSPLNRIEDHTNSFRPWLSEAAGLDTPVLLDQLNLNLNQERGPDHLDKQGLAKQIHSSTKRQIQEIFLILFN